MGARLSRVGYAPIVRLDPARREIELCATSEALDAHGTVFDYEASKDAFTRWIGNVREMHERRAVGTRVAARCDDEARKVYVRVRISRGAQDTWEKVLDGTLRGASIGAANVVWRRERRNLGGRMRAAQVATRYDLAELSLVDSPSNPDALGVTIVRDAEPNLALLDRMEDEDNMEEDEALALVDLPALKGRSAREGVHARGMAEDVAAQRAIGAAGDSDQSGAPPSARAALHAAASAALTGCGCALCELALAALDASGDGDDGDSDGSEGYVADDTAARGAGAGSHARMTAALLRISARELARLDLALRGLLAHGETLRDAASATSAASPSDMAADAEAEVAALRARVARLEAQPLPGGPAARAVEKTLAALPLDGSGLYGAPPAGAESLSALEALAGRLRDPQAQMAVAAEMIRLQQGQG